MSVRLGTGASISRSGRRTTLPTPLVAARASIHQISRKPVRVASSKAVVYFRFDELELDEQA